ncbi:hypothetical protein D3C79_787980 [compost metagenome]
MPWLAWFLGCLVVGSRFCGGRLCLFRRRGLGRLAGEEFLPVELAVLLQGGPGFQFFAADLAHGNPLFGQVDAGFADIEARQAYQWATIWRLYGEWRDTYRGVVQQQLGFLGQVERVVRVEVDHAVLQHQRHGIANVGPEQLHLAVGDFQSAL